MGSGKTTIGRELASLLARPLVDSDVQVRELTGMTVAELSERAGVNELRRLEYEALTRALASPVPTVIAAAAGVVLDETARHRLREAFVVWLRAEPETLAVRVAGGPTRPLLGENPLTVLREMSQLRGHLYAALADVVVDVDQLPPAAAARWIADELPIPVESDAPGSPSQPRRMGRMRWFDDVPSDDQPHEP
ncbi:MAG: shikimate kinase [Actinomycetota bacterium]|nr:shikimate kinase [Actinomycetota bacterium]